MRKMCGKPVLDPCCGSRMFYFDKESPLVDFRDNRVLHKVLCDGRVLDVAPGMVGDVCSIDAPDGSYGLVVFDPPHLVCGNGWQVDKYGKLPKGWQIWMAKAFDECWRVLRPEGTLVFKWNEYHVPLKEVLACFSQKPLLGNKKPVQSKTHWLVFYKAEKC